MASIEAAIAEIESLKPGEKINYTKTARKYGISRSTLSRRHRGVQHTRAEQYNDQRTLNNGQAKTLIKWINDLTDKGLSPTLEMLRNFAKELTGKKPGKQWPTRFLKKYDDQLTARYTTGIDSQRKRADSAYKYSLYFELMAKKLKEYDIRPEDMYNMDEKGFLIGVLSKGKRIFSRSKLERGGFKQRLQDENREWITTIACISADGSFLSPGLIYQAVSGNIQDSWLQVFTPGHHTCFLASTSSGWTNDDIGYAWLTNIFDRETKEKSQRRWRLLILDGHGSHITMKFINFCDENKILLAIYPPHSTHTLQPLDVSIFGPLSTAYSAELEQFLHDCQGIGHVTKRDFFQLFWPAWNTALSKENIESAWNSVGLHPWNPEKILIRFTKKDSTRPSSSDSSHSILSAEDWRRVERLLQQTVSDIYDNKAQKLSSTMHSLSTENILLKLRCSGLEKALKNEQKKRQRGKPLPFDLSTLEGGNAIFYSPNKIQEARDLQAQKYEAIQLDKAAKQDIKLRREQEKKEKQLLLEERKRIRSLNDKIRQQTNVQKQHQKEEKLTKKANLQLQNDMNQVDKGKTKVSIPSTPKIRKDTIDQNEVVVAEASYSVSRRGRQIRLPARFRDH